MSMMNLQDDFEEPKCNINIFVSHNYNGIRKKVSLHSQKAREPKNRPNGLVSNPHLKIESRVSWVNLECLGLCQDKS